MKVLIFIILFVVVLTQGFKIATNTENYSSDYIETIKHDPDSYKGSN